MTDVVTPEVVVPEEAETVMPDERTLLMQRARMMGIRISNNIGLDALKAKLAAHVESAEEAQDEAPALVDPVVVEAAPPVSKKPLTHQQIREKLIRDNMKLVRLRITCLDPKKKDLPGEIFTVANRFIGTVRKYVPFGDQTENGYHVPHCIYEMLKARKFLHIRTMRTKNDGDRVETSYVPEFALEVLPQLTEAELKKLAIQQAAAAGNG